MLQNTISPLQDSEERFQLLVEAVQDYAIYLMDTEGHIITWNSGAERNKGYTRAEIIGKHFSRFFLPEDVAAGLPTCILSTAKDAGRFEGQGWRMRKDGSRFWASVVLNALRDDDGDIIGFAKVTRDLTQTKLQEEALRASEAALQAEKKILELTLNSIADGVVATDQLGNVTLLNPVAEAMTGWFLGSALGKRIEEVFQLFDATSGDAVQNPVRDCLQQNKAFYLQEGVILRSRDGSKCDIQDSAAPIRSSLGDVIGSVLVFQDVTHLRAVQREMTFSATHDSLTMLPNRQLFLDSLDNALHRSKSSDIQHTVCYLDLDRFKIVNDTAGHAAGDMLLRTIADMLSRLVRGSDLVARLGGDEFAIILYGCTLENAQSTLNKILEAIAALPFLWEDRMFRISASIGVASITADSTLASVMKQADVACYAAKHAGRNRISVYRLDEGDGHESHQQMEIAAGIRDAIATNRFSLHAQKILSLRGVHGPRYELLLRMHRPNGTMISPAQFIPAAERYDLMAELDRWVLHRILMHYGAELSAIPDLHLCINLSANSLNDPKFLPFFLDLVQHSMLLPTALTIEITETALINNLMSASSVIEEVRAMGCKVALDDFGIGLCSFSYLRTFKVDYIKIEGSFVRNIPESAVDLSIVRAINNIAHEISAQTIAEFVESDEILTMLKELDIDFAQGYALGKPEPIENIVGFVSAVELECI